MKKRMYEKPSMKVFVLKQKPHLLAGSGGSVTSAGRGDVYGLATEETWEE